MIRTLGLTAFCGPDDERAGDFVHLLRAELRPALRPFGEDAAVALAVGEEEIVQHDFVEVPGSELGHHLHFVPVRRSAVAVGLKAVRFVDGQSQGPGHRDPPARQELLQRRHLGFGGQLGVARRFEVDLVHLDLLLHIRPLRRELLEARGNRVHFLVAEVHGDAEVVVSLDQRLRSEKHRESTEHPHQRVTRERDRHRGFSQLRPSASLRQGCAPQSVPCRGTRRCCRRRCTSSPRTSPVPRRCRAAGSAGRSDRRPGTCCSSGPPCVFTIVGWSLTA